MFGVMDWRLLGVVGSTLAPWSGGLGAHSNVFTTRSIVGLSLGSGCQHLWRKSRICVVSPVSSVSAGNSGLVFCEIKRATVAGDCPSNGGLSANSSKASMANAKISAGLDSPIESLVMSTSSGARGASTARRSTITVRRGLHLTGPNP